MASTTVRGTVAGGATEHIDEAISGCLTANCIPPDKQYSRFTVKISSISCRTHHSPAAARPVTAMSREMDAAFAGSSRGDDHSITEPSLVMATITTISAITFSVSWSPMTKCTSSASSSW